MSWRRREILRLAAGAGAALLGGCPPARRARGPGEIVVPDGELVGAGETRGHALRDQPPPAWPGDDAAAVEKVGVLVVGGGVAGLGAAWRLAHAGERDVVVVELEDAPGGTARGGVVAGQACPWGAHYVAAPDPANRALVTLLDEAGAVEGRTPEGAPIWAEGALVRDPEERLYYKGRWTEGLGLAPGASGEDARQLAAFEAEVARWVAWRDARGRRAFDVPVARCSDDAEVTALDRLTMAEWLDARGLGAPRLRWLIDYACRDDYGATAAQVSAWAGLFYFCARVPAAGAASAPFLTWPEGNARLVATLARAVPGGVRTGVTVARIEETGTGDGAGADGAGAVRVTARAADGRVLGFRAERVIFAAPGFVAARVLAAARPAAAAAWAPPVGAWLVANLALGERPVARGFPLAWDNVLYESDSLGYVVATHQQGRDRGPTVLTYYLPLVDDDPAAGRRRLFAGDRAHWARHALADLARAHPDLPGLCTRADVARWGHAMVRPAPGVVWGGARAAAATPVGRVHFAHTELSGVALLEEALDHGVRAAEEVLAARGRTVTSWR